MGTFGKYRAIVSKVADPEKRGRIKVSCPSVYGTFESPWCLPCVPVAFDKGGFFAIPKLDEVVWIEFEEGDTNKPIWTGSWWTPENTPSKDYLFDKEKIIKAKNDLTLIFKEEDKAIEIYSTNGNKVLISDKEITLSVSSGAKLQLLDGGVLNITASKINMNQL